MALYAYTESSYRAISDPSDAAPGEKVAEQVPAETLSAIRRGEIASEVASRIAATNWAMMEDADVTANEKAAILAYRAALRALPQHPDFPDAPWPELPRTGGVGSETAEQS